MDPLPRTKENDSPDSVELRAPNLDIEDDDLDLLTKESEETKAPLQSAIGAATITPTAEVDKIHTTPELVEAAGDHSNASPDAPFLLKLPEVLKQLSLNVEQKEEKGHTPEKEVSSPEKEKDENETDKKTVSTMEPPPRKKENACPDNLDIGAPNIDLEDDDLEMLTKDSQHTKAPPQSDIGAAPITPIVEVGNIQTTSELDNEANAEPDFNLGKLAVKVEEGLKNLSPFTKRKEMKGCTPGKGVSASKKGKDETDAKIATPPCVATPPIVASPPRVVPEVPRYSCGYKKMGKALFFYCPKTMVGERERCQEDLSGIRTKLSELGFDTTFKPVNNASQDQMKQAIKDVCDSKYSDCGMLVCVILSNADHGLIYPQEQPRFSVTKLSEQLSHGTHPVWAGKPKIFILLTPFSEVKTQSLSSGAGVQKEVVIPSEADFLYLWSFVPESYEQRDELKRILAKGCTDKAELNRKLEELCRDEKKREKISKESAKLLKRRMSIMKMSLTAEHLVRELSEAGQRDLGDIFTRVINSVVSEVEGHMGTEIKGGSMPTERMIYMVSQLRKRLVLSK